MAFLSSRFARHVRGLLPALLAGFAAAAQPPTAPAPPAGAGSRDLSFYLEQARQNSPLAIDVRNQGQAARLEAQRLLAFYTKAQLTLTGNYLVAPVLAHDGGRTELRYSGLGAGRYSGYDVNLSNGSLYQGIATLTKPLFNTARAAVAGQQALATAQVLTNTSRLSLHDLEKLVGDQYILCRQDLDQLGYVRELLGILDRQRLLVRKLVEASLLKQSDYTLLTLEYQTQQLALNTYQTGYRRDLLDLNVLCGLGDTAQVLLPAPALRLQRPAPPHSLFAERFRLDSLNVAVTQQFFELRYRPQLNAFATGGLDATTLADVPNRFGTSAGLNFTWFLLDGHQRQLSRDRAQVLLGTSRYARQNFQLVNPVRLTRLLDELRALEQRQALAREQVNSYRSLLDSYKREVVAGQLPVVNYVQVLKNFALTSRDLVLLENNRLLLINAYNYWNW